MRKLNPPAQLGEILTAERISLPGVVTKIVHVPAEIIPDALLAVFIKAGNTPLPAYDRITITSGYGSFEASENMFVRAGTLTIEELCPYHDLGKECGECTCDELVKADRIQAFAALPNEVTSEQETK